jgi:hypothetical protein
MHQKCQNGSGFDTSQYTLHAKVTLPLVVATVFSQNMAKQIVQIYTNMCCVFLGGGIMILLVLTQSLHVVKTIVWW